VVIALAPVGVAATGVRYHVPTAMQSTGVNVGRSLRGWGVAGSLAGLFVLAFTVYWSAAPIPTAEPLEGRYGDNAVLAMEFARTPAELARVIGHDPPTADDAQIRVRLDRVNQLDFVYMLAYGVLLAAGFVLLVRHQGRDRRYLVGVAVTAAGVLADGWENRALLTLTESGADTVPLLASLRVATYAKWELLAVATALHGWALWRERGVLRRMVGLTGLAAIPLGVLLWVDAATFSPILTLAFGPIWLAIFLRCASVAMNTRRGHHSS
jgi:hypothetical protein